MWVDGAARVACVTPVRRVEGRAVTTLEGLADEDRRSWGEAFAAAGASQCGFCTPGIIMRLAALGGRGRPVDDRAVRSALLAHLCRCTGWQSVVEAADAVLGGGRPPVGETRDPLLAAWRAQLEGPAFQTSGPEVALGGGGFAEDTAPADALVAVPAGDGFVLDETLPSARGRAGKVQGRRSTVPLRAPVGVPAGEWVLTLQTTWVEPAYLEPDASWCVPGGRPASPLANGGAFGGKRHSPLPAVAQRLAGETGRPVRAVWSREDVVRGGPKRPPVAVGVDRNGNGVLRAGRSAGDGPLAGYADAVAAGLPGLAVEYVDVAGPPTSVDLRGAGWAEAAVVAGALPFALSGTTGPGLPVEVVGRRGGRARVTIGADGSVEVAVWAGEVLDRVTLRSYCLGAVHQALGWVRHEAVAVDRHGEVHDLTIRSFGILPARDTPHVHVTIHPDDGLPVNGSDAVFAATAAAAWLADGLPARWPTRRSGWDDEAPGAGGEVVP